MSREIKFRAWNSETGKMVDLYKITQLAVNVPNLDGLFIPFKEEWPLMQCTGLKDKNGVEIYEGDIVKLRFYDGIYGMTAEDGVIEWHDGSAAFKWLSGEPSDGNNYWLSERDDKFREVIGNIYENPELLN